MPDLEIDDMQGLIMSGYGHLDYGGYLFLQFNDAEAGRAWLDELIPNIATGARWPKDSDGRTIKPESALNVAFTCTGLDTFGLPEESQETFPHEFRQGMAHPHRARILGDSGSSAPDHWEVGGEPEKLHAILIVLAQTGDLLETLYEQHAEKFVAHQITLLARMNGSRLPDNREHFGFLDGLSQPTFSGTVRNPEASEPMLKPGEFVLGYENEYGQIPNSPSLNGSDIGRNGSFLIFRKLYQDVAAFWQYVAANTPGDEDDDEMIRAMSDEDRQIWLASKFVGRWPRGTPMVKAPYKDDPDIDRSKMNSFMFWNEDFDGQKCPLGSHIRRANPRDGLGPDKEEANKMAKRHLIIRRGLPYGAPLFDLDTLPPPSPVEDDGVDRGLMFLCVNANIARQFEFVQQSWLNNVKFHGLYTDKDPISGDSDGTGTMTIQRDPVRRRVSGLPRFVHVKGGGYFFLPGIAGLKRLAALD